MANYAEESILPINVYSKKPVGGFHSSDNMCNFIRHKSEVFQTPQRPKDIVSGGTVRKWAALKEDIGLRVGQLSHVVAETLHAQPGPPTPRFFCGLVSRCSHLLNFGTLGTNLYKMPRIQALSCGGNIWIMEITGGSSCHQYTEKNI